MKKANFIILDVETGGLKPINNPITQIALLTIDHQTLMETNRFETYVKPYNDLKIEQAALQATGLKMSDINNGMSIKEVVNILIDYFKQSMINNRPENRPIIVGHNIQFDIGFINYAFQFIKKELFENISPTQICTMAMSKLHDPGIESLKLSNCCENVGIKLKDAHKAMNDVVATTDLFRAHVNILRNGEAKVNKGSDKEIPKSRQKFQF